MLEIRFNEFPVLTTERLCLRRKSIDDIQDIFLLRTNDAAMKYIDKPKFQSIDEAVAFFQLTEHGINNHENISWAITLKDANRLIGDISFHRIDKKHHRAEIGYMLLPEYWRKGIVQEAVSAVIRYGFMVLHFHSIEAVINPNNAGSAALLEKNGFIREAYYKENYHYNGQFLDSAVYSLLKSNYLAC